MTTRLIFTFKPALTTTKMSEIKTMPESAQPKWLDTINEAPLVKSLLEYGDVYACPSSYYLTDKIIMPTQHNRTAVLHLVFAEPFQTAPDSVSAIDIWGTGVNENSAQNALIRHVKNMWDYESLLTHFFHSQHTGGYLPDMASAYTEYVYTLYDPKDISRHKLTKGLNSKDGIRPYILPCGLIFTDASLRNTKTK